MKKIYLSPIINVIEFEGKGILCASPNSVNNVEAESGSSGNGVNFASEIVGSDSEDW